MNRPLQPEHKTQADRTGSETLTVVADALRGLQFGTVTVTVQDGVIIQVERTERRRFTRPARVNPA